MSDVRWTFSEYFGLGIKAREASSKYLLSFYLRHCTDLVAYRISQFYDYFLRGSCFYLFMRQLACQNVAISSTGSGRERLSLRRHEDYHIFFSVYGVPDLLRSKRSYDLAYASMVDCDYPSVAV